MNLWSCDFRSHVRFLFSVCSGPPAGPQQDPFLCLDLVYISVLLQEFGFPPHQQLRVSPPPPPILLIVSPDPVSVSQLAKTINQVETSWALGATFNYMESLRGSWGWTVRARSHALWAGVGFVFVNWVPSRFWWESQTRFCWSRTCSKTQRHQSCTETFPAGSKQEVTGVAVLQMTTRGRCWMRASTPMLNWFHTKNKWMYWLVLMCRASFPATFERKH